MKNTAQKVGRAFSRTFLRDTESGWLFPVIISALYAVLLALGHAHHEFWRDETHPWVVARMSPGFGDLATGDRVYDGHPPLWYWYLHVWSWLTRDIVGLHIATVVAEVGAGFFLLKWGPFPRLLKVLLLCSYLLGYEYGIMSRNYTVGVTAVFAFAATYHPLRLRMSSFVCLALLALSSVFGFLMAAALGLLLFFRRARLDWGQETPSAIWTLRTHRQIFLGAAFLGVALAFSFVVTTPPDPNPYSPAWNFEQLNSSAILPSLNRLLAAFVTLRKPNDPGYWVAVSQYAADYPKLFERLAYVLPAILVLSLLPAWPEALVFFLGSTLMSVVLVARYAGHIRHWGHFFLLFLVVSWVARRERPQRKYLLNTFLLLIVGVLQVQGFVVSYRFDWKRAFSDGEEMARAIQRLGLQDLPLVMGPDWDAMAVTGYLDRSFISSETEEINQTMVFHGRRGGFSVEGLVQKSVAVAKEKHGPVLVISNRPLPAPAGAASFKLVYQTVQPLLMGDEMFWAYRLEL